ncbi:MAG: NAD-dependent epimerase/dehydratase family protein [Oscillatoriales cyanobacterium SM2_1_8]|nr:NAD-dependent epimerase/dehydratase family protein [Oscillatoriales cyanobacterium SM2_1_8]
MKHLVTGGSGFLGRAIAQELWQRGETVKILDVWCDADLPPDIEYIECDIRDRDRVERAMRGMDLVHHNVALVPLAKAGRQFWSVNVDGARIAAEAAVGAGVSGFVHMSSSAVFGNPVCPAGEATPLHPVEIYGRAKLAGERAVRAICTAAGLPLVVVRPRTILGSGRLGIFQILFEWIREGRNVYTIGDGRIDFQFVQAQDLLDAYLLAMAQPGTYNIGTDRYGTLRQALEHLIGHAGSRSRVKALPTGLTIGTLRALDVLGLSPLAPWHYLTYHKPFYFDLEPLHRLGWRARYSNDEMLQESYDWFCAHYERLQAEKARSPHRRPVKEKLLWLLKQFS